MRAQKLAKVDYICSNCGRDALETDYLCYPDKTNKEEKETYEPGV